VFPFSGFAAVLTAGRDADVAFLFVAMLLYSPAPLATK
jgi:hypothetical protein